MTTTKDTPKPDACRLIAFTIRDGGPADLGHIGRVVVDNPPPHLAGWSLAIRGGAAFLISPPGWTQKGQPLASLDKTGERRVLEMPRTCILLHWAVGGDALAAVDKLQRYDCGPFMTAKAVLAEGEAA